MLTETVLERYIFSRFWLDGIFFLLIEVLLTRLTVSCDNWNELTCWISTTIRQPLSCYRACLRDPGLTIQAVSYAADTRSAWKRLCTPGYPAARGCLDFKPVQVACSRENGQAGAVVVTDARAGRATPRRAPLARTHGRLDCSQGTLKSPRYYIVITVHSLEPASRWQGRLTDFILCPINTDPS